MTGRLDGRVTRLGQRIVAPWRSWVAVPVDQWPDETLDACIRDQFGLEPAVALTDALLESIIATKGG